MFEDRDELTHLDFEVRESRVEAAETDVEVKSSAVRESKGTTPRAYLLWFGSRLVIVI